MSSLFEVCYCNFSFYLKMQERESHELRQTPNSARDVKSGDPKSGPSTNPDTTGTTTIVTISEQCAHPDGHVEVGILFDPSDVSENPLRNPVTSTDRLANPLIMTDILTNPDSSLPVTSSATIGNLLDTSDA